MMCAGKHFNWENKQIHKKLDQTQMLTPKRRFGTVKNFSWWLKLSVSAHQHF